MSDWDDLTRKGVSAPVTMTGRIWGYTDELDWVVRNIHGVYGEAAFQVLDRKVIGSRGWFTKRYISKYEYVITANSSQSVTDIQSLVARLVEQIS